MLNSIKCNTQVVSNQRFRVSKTILILLVTIVTSCGPSKLKTTNRIADFITTSEISDSYFRGILIVDPEKRDTIAELNSRKYFTPASNTKIFTLYTGLTLLPNQVPSLNYIDRNDTLYFAGTGDPTWLHPYFKDSSAINFLKNHQHLALYLNNYEGERYQPGWAWEDFDTYFSPELGPLPLYGNVATVMQSDSLVVSPSIFSAHTYRSQGKKRRDEHFNRFYVPYTLDTLHIPYLTSNDLTKQLLEKQMKRPIQLIQSFPKGTKRTLFGVATDSLFKKMMHDSDNFLAEQIMLMASSQVSDSLSFEISKDSVLAYQLKDLNQHPRWVDGSGLSRYNLFTPESMVTVLYKLYKEVPRNRLFELFPHWDESGTLENPDSGSFIIAKSGSLGNNYNLSGYLITKSGKILIFSYMNNHFRVPSQAIKNKIMETLESVHDLY